MKRHEIRELLLKLKRKVRNNEFYAVARGKGKTPAEPLIIKFVVANLTVADFNKKELDHNGSGEFIFVFIEPCRQENPLLQLWDKLPVKQGKVRRIVSSSCFGA